MNKILVVVDMQNDFLTGTLANESAVNVIPNIKREIESGNYTHIIFTRDTHYENYLETQEGKRLPVEHCIKYTWGWEVTSELPTGGENVYFLNKPTFGYNDWYDFVTYTLVVDGNEAEFTFTGTVGSICVVNNALIIKSQFPESTVKCLSDCVADLSESDKNATLTVMKNSQIDVS